MIPLTVVWWTYRIIKLIKNFRSHPSILQYPNDRFYNSELQTYGDSVMVRSLENAEALEKKGFPIIFHGVIGKDEREKSSPSFFNIDEASLVRQYCETLIGNRKNGIRMYFSFPHKIESQSHIFTRRRAYWYHHPVFRAEMQDQELA